MAFLICIRLNTTT